MNKLERQLAEDRALRDAARELFTRELAYVKTETTPQALGERMAGKVGEKADSVSDDAIAFAEKHRNTALAAIAAMAVGAGLWVARRPILSGLSGLCGTCEKETGVDDGSSESPSEDASDE